MRFKDLRRSGASRQDAFPVVGFDGRLTGIVLASQFDDMSGSDRARLRLDQIVLAVPPAYLAAPGDPAGPLVSRAPLGGKVATVVVADGRSSGMVTVSDLQQALRWRRLTRTGQQKRELTAQVASRRGQDQVSLLLAGLYRSDAAL